MKAGVLVQCLETKRFGVVIEIERAAVCMMALVKWSDDSTNWMDFVEIVKISS